MFHCATEIEDKMDTANNFGMSLRQCFLSFIKGPHPSLRCIIFQAVQGTGSIVNAGKILAALIDRLCHSLLVSGNLGSEAVLPHADCL